MMAGSRRLRIYCGGLALLAASAAIAGEHVHVVRPGESASAIAKHYYGDYELAATLLLFNDRRNPTIHPGETLRVPLCDVHRVRPGDTWSTLSRRYLGDASRWSTVAQLNGLEPERALQIGQEIVFPVVLKHRLRRGETLAGLAEQHWGDPGRARLLQEFNGLDDPRRLALGAMVEVPLLTLRPRPAAQPATLTAARRVVSAVAEKPPPARPEKRVEPTPTPDPLPPVAVPQHFARELGTAARAFRLGEYEKAQALLEKLRGQVESRGTDSDRRDYWRQLGFVHVAFDRREDACGAFAAMERLGGAADLDPVHTSPKISAALEACR